LKEIMRNNDEVDDLIYIVVLGGYDHNCGGNVERVFKEKLGVYIRAASCKINGFIRYPVS